MYSPAGDSSFSSTIKREGIPSLTRQEDGTSTYPQWLAGMEVVLRSHPGLIDHVLKPYAKVDPKFHGALLTLPTAPVKYEPLQPKAGGETDKDFAARRQVHYQNVEFYMLEMKQFEFETQQYLTCGEEARQAKYDLNDNKVKALILATVDPTISASFQPGLHAYDLWTHLAKMFGTTSQLTKGAAYRSLMMKTYEEGQVPQELWDFCLRIQRDLKDSPFEIPLPLLQQIYLLMFAQVDLYSFVYHKFRSIELHTGENFQKLLTELTITFQDNGSRPTGSAPAMFGRSGAAPPSTTTSNDCHAQVKCPQCAELGHQKENCRKWRQLNPTLHVKTVTEPKHNRQGDKKGSKGKGDPKPSVSAKLAADADEDVDAGMAYPESDVPLSGDTAVDGC